MSDAELAAERAKAHESATATAAASTPAAMQAGGADDRGSGLKVWLAWLAVGVPMAWGVWMTLTKALPLFRMG